MKNSIKSGMCITIALLSLSISSVFAQWNWTPTPWNDRWGQTNNPALNWNDIKAIGVGDFTGFNSHPDAALHINTNFLTPTAHVGLFFTPGEVFRTDCPAGLNTWWRLMRNGAEVGNIFSNATAGINGNNFSIQASTHDITFHTQPIISGTGMERMRIVGVNRTLFAPNAVTTYPVTEGNTGIGNASPLSRLQVGTDVSNTGGGYRDWMYTGTFYNNANDNMYVGLRVLSPDVTDAIINWGNNPAPGSTGDRLRFVFTSLIAAGLNASDANGLEIARMITDGNIPHTGIGDFETPVEDPRNTLDVQGNTVIGTGYAGNANTPAPQDGLLVFGNTGMGMLFNNTLIPKRRLDIVDEKDGPQLRLTQTLNANINDGIFTDFHTDNNGNLMIRPSHNLTPMNVGIDHPSNTALLAQLDVNGNGCFRNMPPTTQPYNQVLIDNQGVLWKGPVSTGGTTLGNSCGATPNNPLSGDWEIPLNQHNFYFSGNHQGSTVNNVIIGNNCGYSTMAKLDVYQNSGINGTIGLYIENKDNAGGLFSLNPVIGIKSIVSHNNLHPWTNNVFKIAGWFECSPGWFPVQSTTVGLSQFAIFVPQNGGMVSIGFPYPSAFYNNVEFAVNGSFLSTNNIISIGSTSPSDMKLKKNINYFNNGIDIIKKIHPITFNYNGAAYFDTSKIIIGANADEVVSFAPYAVDTLKLQLYPSDTTLTDVLGINNNAILYTSINAIKELDSITTSLSGRIDTLTSDDDWYKVGTTVAPASIYDDKYTFGNTYINVPVPYFSLYPYVRFASFQNTGLLDQNSNSMMSIAGRFHNEYAHEQDASAEYGLFSTAQGNGCNYRSARNYGGYFKAKNARNNFAGYFEANSSCTYAMSYGVYSVVTPGAGFAGFFDGDVEITGNETKLSDVRFKTNITPVSSALNIIEQLKPVKFNFVSQQGVSLPSGNQYGLVAQEVEPVLPEVVTDELIPAKYDSLGNMISDTIHFKGLNYNAFIPIAIEGIKELKHENDSLKQIIQNYDSRISAIENMLSECCSQNKSTTVTVTIDTRPLAIPVHNTTLNQNHPNPFKTITLFSYHLGESGYTELIIEDMYGHVVKSLVGENENEGDYSVEWDASEQPSGLYFYTLKVNSKVLVKKAIKIE